MSHPQREDRQFRRGMVLGLTLAEILLLLIFLLMLILASRLRALHHQVDEEHARRSDAEAAVASLQPLMAKIKLEGDKFDITKEWERVQDELAKAQTELSENRDAISLMERRRAKEPGHSAAQISEEIENEASLGRRFAEDAHSLEPSLQQREALKAFEADAAAGKLLIDKSGSARNLVADAAACRSSLTTCKAQNANLSARLGGTLPSCWIDASGKSQYIFDAHLREDGIVLNDNHVPGREADEAQLPIKGFAFGTGVEAAAFIQAGMPILAYSNQNECRFYVRVYDETGPASKLRYKELLNGIESIFYKLPMKTAGDVGKPLIAGRVD